MKRTPASEAKTRAESCFQEAERCRRCNDLTTAEGLYSEALRLDPSLQLAYVRRGLLLLLKGRVEQAVEDLTAALRLNGRRCRRHLVARRSVYSSRSFG